MRVLEDDRDQRGEDFCWYPRTSLGFRSACATIWSRVALGSGAVASWTAAMYRSCEERPVSARPSAVTPFPPIWSPVPTMANDRCAPRYLTVNSRDVCAPSLLIRTRPLLAGPALYVDVNDP